MPKAERKSLCRCHLYCTKLNRTTGEYEGLGKLVSRATKSLHASDSRRESTSAYGYSSNNFRSITRRRTNPTDGCNSDDSQAMLELILRESEWMSSWSVTSPTAPLIFINDPRLNGVYEQPSPDNLLSANTGKYALDSNSQRNETFLQVENSYCSMVHRLLDLRPSIGRTVALNLIEQKLAEIHGKKGLKWEQIRSEHAHLDNNIVDTGQKFLYVVT